MTFKLPEFTFPPLELKEQEKQALEQQAQQVVQETVASSDEFLAHGCKLPQPEQWKLIKAKESFRVYRERQTKAELELKRSKSDEPELPEFVSRTSRLFSSVDTITDTIDYLPTIVGYGTVDGTLDDTMYGAFAADDETWRLKSSYVNDHFDDAKVLATILGPTKEDPYRFLGVKWFTSEFPIGVGAILQRRDFLILEATGLAYNSKGDQVGYSLYQSIDIPQIPELKSMRIIRGYLSACFVNRTLTPSMVGIFCRGFLDSGGYMPVSLGASLMSDSLLSALNVMECAYMKKLMWVVKQKQREQIEAARTRANSSSSQCQSCKRSVNKMTSFLSGTNCRTCLAVSLCIAHAGS